MSESPTRLRIRRPDDWHLHLRDGDVMRLVLPATSRVFAPVSYTHLTLPTICSV